MDDPQLGRQTLPTVRSGPFAAHLGQTLPHPSVVPFTWQEKRAFDYQNPTN